MSRNIPFSNVGQNVSVLSGKWIFEGKKCSKHFENDEIRLNDGFKCQLNRI